MNTHSIQRYSKPLIAMHWLTVLVFMGLYASINLIGMFAEGDAGSAGRQWAMATHFSLGLLVFGLVVLRLLLRVRGPVPPIVPAPKAWQQNLAQLGHLALYAMMVLMPLVGLAAVNTHGHSVGFFGLPVPALWAESERWSHTLQRLYEGGGKLGYFLVAAHVLAALWHHFLLKDNTLDRMRLR